MAPRAISKIFSDYWNFIENKTHHEFALYDLQNLPFPKSDLLIEIIREYVFATNSEDDLYKSVLMRGVVNLSLFQKGVGAKPIYMLGRSRRDVPADLENLDDAEKQKVLNEAALAHSESYQKLWDKQSKESRGIVSILTTVSDLAGQWRD